MKLINGSHAPRDVRNNTVAESLVRRSSQSSLLVAMIFVVGRVTVNLVLVYQDRADGALEIYSILRRGRAPLKYYL